jgi:hypothetical protein
MPFAAPADPAYRLSGNSWFNPLYWFCRHTTEDRIRRHILMDDRPGSHHGIFAHRHAGQDRGACPNPGFNP